MKYQLIIPFIIVLSICSCQNNRPVSLQQPNPARMLISTSTKVAIATETTDDFQVKIPQTKDIPTNSPIATETNQPLERCPPSQKLSRTDGIIVAYISEKKVWIWCHGEKYIVDNASDNSLVDLSDDGKILVYTKNSFTKPRYFDLYAFTLDGEEEKLLLDANKLAEMVSAGPEEPNVLINWIPGPHSLLLNDSISGNAYKLDVNTGDVVEISSAIIPGYLHLAPNGKSFALISSDQIFLGELDKAALAHVLDYFPISFGGEGFYNIIPVWSQDSSMLTIAIPPKDVNEGGNVDVWNIDTDTLAPRLLSIYETNTLENFISPDQKWIIYARRDNPSADFPSSLHLLNLHNTNDTEFARGDVEFIEWAPNGSKFAFSKTPNNSNSKDYFVGIIEQDDVSIQKIQPPTTFLSWLDNDRFLTEEFQVGSLNQKPISIEEKRIYNYDYAVIDK